LSPSIPYLLDCDLLELCQFAGRCLDLKGHEPAMNAGYDIREACGPIHSAMLLPAKAFRLLFQEPEDSSHNVSFCHDSSIAEPKNQENRVGEVLYIFFSFFRSFPLLDSIGEGIAKTRFSRSRRSGI
jgi:hypothetical protein